MDRKTYRYYENNSPELMELYNSVESPFQALIPLLLQHGERVLDVGCGSGRDLTMLLESGFDAFGLEPSDSFRQLAIRHYPDLKGRLLKGSLPDNIEEVPGKFDNILLSAVIMHIPDNELIESAQTLKKLLKDKGLLIVSHCLTREKPLFGDRDEDGRLYVLRSSKQIQTIFEKRRFQKRHQIVTDDTLSRSKTHWETLVFEYLGESR